MSGSSDVLTFGGMEMKKFQYFLVLLLLSSFLSGCWIWVPGPDIIRPGNLPPGR